MASSGAVSLINNRGNIGATLKETLSSNGLKNAMIAAGTVGIMSYASSNWFQGQAYPITGKISGPTLIPRLTDPASLGRFAAVQLAGWLAGGAVKGGCPTAWARASSPMR